MKKMKHKWLKLMLCLQYLLTGAVVFADNYVIPISDVDKTQSGQDFSNTAMAIIQKDILPLLEIGGAVTIFFVALSGLWKGYKDYQREKDMSPLKGAIFAAALLVIFGGAILYGMDILRHYQF